MPFTKSQQKRLKENNFNINKEKDCVYYKLGESSFIQVDKINQFFEYEFIDDMCISNSKRTRSLKEVIEFKNNLTN